MSCSEDEDKKPALQVPTSYDGTNFVANTARETAVKNQLIALTNEVKKGRTGQKVQASTLRSLFNAGNPSLKAVTTPYYANFLDKWFDEVEKASGGATLNLSTLPNGEGGTLGGYLFDNTGIEPEQLIEKGLFEAALYNHAVSLLQGNITPATIDQLVCIYGATPSFANTDNAQNPNKDDLAAKYAARRTKSSGGIYLDIKNDLIKAQAAAKAGNAYKAELMEALTSFRKNWEKAMGATIINYCFAAISTLSATNSTDNAKAAALHAYSEGVGFLHGFRTINASYKIITDAQIDQLLILMNAPYNGTPSSYLFVSDAFNQLPKLQNVIKELQKIYGFTDAQLEDFKKNWVNEEKR
ncbi:MAG: hypothetical protein NZ521_04760 [Flammeovirgaceae bacterium]|nr:hypothetical protein [Flammeovirgaceae bacterium]MDW8287530.1 hypothetical protein [Flammeovirgaceae bacterium]